MKYWFTLIVMIIYFGNIFYTEEKNIPENEIPMYGYVSIDNSPEKYLPRIVLDGEDKKYALKGAVQLAWKYFYEEDYKTSIKRFNQAWMIDPACAEVYYGFGVLLSLEGKRDEAEKFYKKTIDLDSHHPMAMANLARVYKDIAYELYIKKGILKLDEEIEEKLNVVLELYEKANQNIGNKTDFRLDSVENDRSYIYYQWAIALAFHGEFDLAWEKIELCREHGGSHLIEQGFIEELSNSMPEPNKPTRDENKSKEK